MIKILKKRKENRILYILTNYYNRIIYFSFPFIFFFFFLPSTGEGVQTRRQTDSQTTRFRNGHEPGGSPTPAGHSAVGRWPDQWPGPGRAQRQHTHAHVRPFPVRSATRLLSGLGVRSRLEGHEVCKKNSYSFTRICVY